MASPASPCKIVSRPAAMVHGGLGVKASEFETVVDHLEVHSYYKPPITVIDVLRSQTKDLTQIIESGRLSEALPVSSGAMRCTVAIGETASDLIEGGVRV
ncbi:MAG: hypothetical protein ACR2Q4_07815 [Geminicoccaceae bacterium]